VAHGQARLGGLAEDVKIYPLRGSSVDAMPSTTRLDLALAFNVEEIMKDVSAALALNMEHADSPLNLDKDFNLELRIKVGDYNPDNNTVENLEPDEVAVFSNFHR
jgi:hypothetical protein